MISQDLVDDNPWWRSPDLIHKDMKIVELDNSTVVWHPRIAHTFNLGEDLVYTLRGPRQTGKTTLIKSQIKKLLESGISPHNIMYYAFDVDNTSRALVNVIKNYLDNTERLREGNRCFMFLDEISAIKDWQRGIKRLWDQHRLENCTVIATGSNTLDIKRSSERLPGRRGTSEDALDKIMLPMKFAEFLSTTDNDLRDLFYENDMVRTWHRRRLVDELFNMKLNLEIERLYAYVPKLNQHLHDYLLTGGTPKVVNEYVAKGHVTESTFATYLDAILGDLQSLRINENIFKQLVQNVLKTIGWTSSWRSLQKDTDIGGVSTVSSYVNTLQNMFVLSTLYQYSVKSKRGVFAKDKKIHVHDPFYFHVLNGWTSGQSSFDAAARHVESERNLGIMVEGVVTNHLIRLAFTRSWKKPNFDYQDVLFHWKYGMEKEVDFIYNDGSGLEIPIEVKFQNKITVRDQDGLINFKRRTDQKSAVILSKDMLSVENECIIIPVSLFLMLV